MKEEDYPALYRAADAASVEAQNSFLYCVAAYAALSVIGAALAVGGIESKTSAAWAAILFAGGLGVSVVMAIKKYENTWYRARAVAESVKTASWRFMMRAEPFASADENKPFTALLQRILKEHSDLAHALAGRIAEGDQITKRMVDLRQSSLDDRMQAYHQHRIGNQRSWYAKKSQTNKIVGERWFKAFVALQGAAIICAILRVASPEFKFWPIEVFVVAATSVFGWMQVKRFRELAAAYAVTAHEIGLASAELADVKTEGEFSSFVGDTENAFSREHTQWVARRDVVS